MTIWYGLDRVPAHLSAGGTVVTIGVFDGVHRGHQQLIERAVAVAREKGLPSVMFTFDPHPTVVFRPEAVPALLGTVEQRARYALELGIDHVVVVAFTPALAALSPQEYIDDVLVDVLRARHIVVGDNFTFGAKAAGTPQTLQESAQRSGFSVDVIPLLCDEDTTVCSTYVRSCLAEGKVAAAEEALGRPFTVVGEVVHGAGRGGRALGFPTANLYFPEKYALPADGVYAGYLTIDPTQPGVPTSASGQPATVGTMPVGQRLPAAISVGTNPTFGHEPRSVESFVLDHDADVYGLTVSVEFIEHLRGMETYSGVEELIAAIERDVATTRQALQRYADRQCGTTTAE